MTTFNLIIADITTIKTDAIVNSANASLQKGSGICKAIYEKAGEKDLDNYQYFVISCGVVAPLSVTVVKTYFITSCGLLCHFVWFRFVSYCGLTPK